MARVIRCAFCLEVIELDQYDLWVDFTNDCVCPARDDNQPHNPDEQQNGD